MLRMSGHSADRQASPRELQKGLIDSSPLSGHMMNDTVLLFHGIARTKKSMAKLAGFLSGHGYRVVNVGYPSTKFSISDLIDIVRPEIDGAAKEAGEGRVHFVGYSMGGLVIRAFLTRYRPANLGRVVMVGTPNNGSQIADFLKSWPLYRKVYGPAGQQLITDQTAMAELFGAVDYDLASSPGTGPLTRSLPLSSASGCRMMERCRWRAPASTARRRISSFRQTTLSCRSTRRCGARHCRF